MSISYILLGGNVGDRIKNLEAAAFAIDQHAGHIQSSSSIYETAAWGNEDQPSFLNQVLKIETAFSAEELLKKLLGIEESMGRIRTEKYSPRTIDIDILLYNLDVIETSSLQVPHPRMAQRSFVLEPLHELAPLIVHPVFHKTIHELLLACPDPLNVKKFFAK